MNASARAMGKVFQREQLPDPGFVKTLFSSPKMALIWTPLRIYLGWQWLTAGLHKVNSPAWTQSGTALKGFWVNATKIDPGQKDAAIHYGWYHNFLKYMLDNQWYSWFGKLIAFGETALGIALIIGAFVGIAAFFGALMNFNFMLAGTASSNPVLFGIAILLILAWKVAGFIGADYALLQAVGTPWKLGHLDPTAAGERIGVGRKVAGVTAGLAAFAVAGVAAVMANNQWGANQPVVGYLVAAVVVVAAWVAMETAFVWVRTARRGQETDTATRNTPTAHPA